MERSEIKTAWDVLEAVKDQIAAEPKSYNQGLWLVGEGARDWRQFTLSSQMQMVHESPCGTVGCVAGWAVRLTQPEGAETYYPDIQPEAQKLLGLTDKQRNELFKGEAAGPCPQPGESHCEHASEGIAHIERFQHRYEDQLKRTKVVLA